jgi:cell division initiation protein
LNISPLDVRNQVFRKSFRGYDSDEVRHFLEAVADMMEQMLKEKEDLVHEHAALKEKAAVFNELETALRDTMITAQRISDEARLSAKREADHILKDADLESKRRLQEAQRQAEEITKSRETVRTETMAFVAKLRSLLEAQLSFLGSVESEVRAEGSKREVEVGGETGRA